jgi:hypothetical protein
MNMHSRSLGVFVPGNAVPNMPLATPFGATLATSPGMGDFVPAYFPIPQNPITGMSGLGQFMPACFPVPQNPVADAANIVPATTIGTGMGCAGGCTNGYGGGCGKCGGMGMGDVNSFVASLTGGDWSGAAMNSDFVTGVPNILLAGAVVWLVGSIIGDTKRTVARVRAVPSATKRKTSAAYRAALAA